MIRLKRAIAGLSLVIAACATSNPGRMEADMEYQQALFARGDIKLSELYRRFVRASEQHLADSPSNRFTNRMVGILGDAAESYEQGRITGAQFESIKARVEIAMAQQDAAFSIERDQAIRDIWLSRRPQQYVTPRTDCITTTVFNQYRTVCR